jgi:hypothetical protein
LYCLAGKKKGHCGGNPCFRAKSTRAGRKLKNVSGVAWVDEEAIFMGHLFITDFMDTEEVLI